MKYQKAERKIEWLPLYVTLIFICCKRWQHINLSARKFLFQKLRNFNMEVFFIYFCSRLNWLNLVKRLTTLDAFEDFQITLLDVRFNFMHIFRDLSLELRRNLLCCSSKKMLLERKDANLPINSSVRNTRHNSAILKLLAKSSNYI